MFSPHVDKYKFRAGLNLKEIHKLKPKGVLLTSIKLYNWSNQSVCCTGVHIDDWGPCSLLGILDKNVAYKQKLKGVLHPGIVRASSDLTKTP